MKKSKLMSVMLVGLMFSGSVLSVSGCSLFGKDKDKSVKNEVVEISESDPWFDSTRTIFGEEFKELGLDWYWFQKAEVVDDKIIMLVSGYYPYEENYPIVGPAGAVVEETVFIGEEDDSADNNSEETDEDAEIIEDADEFEDDTEENDNIAKGAPVAETTVEGDDTEESDEESEDFENAEEESEDDEWYEEGEEDWSDYEYVDTSYYALVAYDMSGHKLWLTDLKSFNSYTRDSSSSVNNFYSDNGKLLLSVNNFDMNSGESKMMYYDIDAESGKVSSEPNTDSDISKFSLVDDYTYSDQEYRFDSCVVVPYYTYTEDYSSVTYNLQVIKDGKAEVLDLAEVTDAGEVYGVSNVFSISDDEILFIVYTDKNDEYIQLNINSMSTEKVEISEELKNLSWNIIQLDGELYVSDTEGLYKVDYKAGTKEKIFSFAECNVNLNDINMMQPLSVSDDEVIFAGSIYENESAGAESYEKYGVYRFTRASSNPNAGKVILKAASIYYFSAAIGEAIYQFNQTNDKYFITYTDKYSSANVDIEDASDMSNDEYSLAYMKGAAELNNQLAMDLMNGEGPDIILDAASFTQLNNSDYLVDLSEYVSELSADKYYTNIFEANRTGDALYQLPIAVYCDAMIGPEGVSSNGKGFTFDEYLGAIDEYNNGRDPFRDFSGRLGIFMQLLDSMETSIVDSEGKVNLDNEEFKAICEYCAELPEMSKYEEEEDVFAGSGSGYMYEEQNNKISTFTMYDVGSYLYEMLRGNEPKAIYGIPSFNGRGPSVRIEESVAISASCANVDGAWEFVNTMLQDDILKYVWDITVSKSVMQEQSANALKNFNAEVEDNLKWSTEQELIEYGMPSKKATEADVQKALEFVEAIDSISGQDQEISTIIAEEIQPFFAGQKSLDEVISIMEDKCQTVVNERG